MVYVDVSTAGFLETNPLSENVPVSEDIFCSVISRQMKGVP